MFLKTYFLKKYLYCKQFWIFVLGYIDTGIDVVLITITSFCLLLQINLQEIVWIVITWGIHLDKSVG